MNKGKPGDWWDYSVNAVVGCSMQCEFPGGGKCWARAQAKRNAANCDQCPTFEPHWHFDRLVRAAAVKKPHRYAFTIMGEPFDAGLHVAMMRTAMLVMERGGPQHTWVVLTKRPQELWMADISAASNVWVLTSAHDLASVDRRVDSLSFAKRFGWPVLGLHLEPICGPVRIPDGLDWVVVGGLSPAAKQAPETAEWTRDVVDQCRAAAVPVWVKGNVPMQESRAWPQEVPR